MASSRRVVWGSRFFKRLAISLALCVLPALAREAPAAEIWVYPGANTTWSTSGDWTTTNDQQTRFDWAYPDNALSVQSVKLMFIPQVSGDLSCILELSVAQSGTTSAPDVTNYPVTLSNTTQGQVTDLAITGVFSTVTMVPGATYIGLKVACPN